MTEPSLFDAPRFGTTYDDKRDRKRLNRQQRAVYDAISNKGWYTLRQISDAAHAPEASVSARLRDFRNIHGMKVEREYLGAGLHQYRLVE